MYYTITITVCSIFKRRKRTTILKCSYTFWSFDILSRLFYFTSDVIFHCTYVGNVFCSIQWGNGFSGEKKQTHSLSSAFVNRIIQTNLKWFNILTWYLRCTEIQFRIRKYDWHIWHLSKPSSKLSSTVFSDLRKRKQSEWMPLISQLFSMFSQGRNERKFKAKYEYL